ncbi:MAG: hypothetical protein GX663_02365 [Clostridiales bacterium]|nr:hypothetical protein [Clostridiales bacterium]
MGRKLLIIFLATAVIATYSFAGAVFASAEEIAIEPVQTEEEADVKTQMPGESEEYQLTEPKTYVAKIGEQKYQKLFDAIQEAKDGEEIELLASCQTDDSKRIAFDKNITISGNHEITVNKGMDINDKKVVFKNCSVKVQVESVEDFMTVFLSKGGALQLDDNAQFTIQGDGSYGMHGIYCSGNNTITLNNSKLVIQNMSEDALEWDDGAGFYSLICNDSEYLVKNCRSGITGTFDATINNSKLSVLNCTGNGSNGSNFYIKNSIVDFSNNAGHGISASNLYVENSKLFAKDNGYNGIVGRNIKINSQSNIHVSGNTKSGSEGAFRVLGSTGYCLIEKGADVTIKDNYRSGIYIDNKKGNMIMNSGVVVNNGNQMAQLGGGLYNKGTFSMGNDVVIYNNHAEKAGDDIFNSGKITLIEVGSRGLILDDDSQTISGWYYDGIKNSEVISGEANTERWNVSATTGDVLSPDYYEEYGVADGEENIIALKAAHSYVTPTEPISQETEQTIKEVEKQPKTGDEASMGPWLVVMATAMAVGLGIVARGRSLSKSLQQKREEY